MKTAMLRNEPDVTNLLLRQLIVVYILLLIFEGALRKWFLPGFANYLVLVRDPVVIMAYICAIVSWRFPLNTYVVSLGTIAFVALIASVAFGHSNPLVTYFGFKSNFLHFPFAFIIGRTLNQHDVIKLGKWWLWGTLLMTVIIILQFYQPQSAWINRAPGGGEGGGFSGALGRYRPPGTFTFFVGVVSFYTLTAAFLIAGLTQHKRYSKLLLSLAALALFISIPISISRTLILAVGLTVAVGIIISALQKNMIPRLIRIGAISCVGLLLASTLPVFDEAKEAFGARWELSTRPKDGGVKTMVVGRIANEFLGPFMHLDKQPVIGAGLGAGTMVGSQYLRGRRKFYLGEGDWFRIMSESGMIIGTAFIMWRVILTFRLFQASLKLLRFKGKGLTMLLFSATGYNIAVGQLGQVTINGFTILGLGLTLASMRTLSGANESTEQDEDTTSSTATATTEQNDAS